MFESVKRWIDALQVDFVRWRYVAGGLSATAVVLSWLAFVGIGPNWGIDFTGGTEIVLQFDQPTRIDEIRGALKQLGLSDDAVQSLNGADSGEFVVRIQDATFGMDGLEGEVVGALGKLYGPDWVTGVSSSAEVSARFVVDYAGEARSHQDITRDLQASLPQARATPGKEERQVVIEVPGLSERIRERIQVAMGSHTFQVLSTDSVGPKVGGDLRRQGFVAIAATLGLILLYVAFRFDIGFAPGAVIALFHDVSVTIGIFVLLGLQFDLTMIGALLTIVGYSLNDTIVIFDRIRENRDRYRKSDLKQMINQSISETLTRTVATSGTTILAITLFLVLGGPVLRNFAFAMLLGIIFGTYSTIFVASPLILVMEEVKPWLARLVVIQDIAPEPIDGEGGSEMTGAPMTESEKRRRERAESEKPKAIG